MLSDVKLGLFLIIIGFFLVGVVSADTTISITKTVSDECSEGFILDDEDTSEDIGDPICKPILMDMVASDDLDDYLIDEIAGGSVVWDDWSTYSPLIEKVEELTEGLETDQEKVEAIANWVRNSKVYSGDGEDIFIENSPAAMGESFSEIWESEEGICVDAAVITTAMLRVAGIPAIKAGLGVAHVVTFYNIDNIWYQIDTTFCLEGSECGELEFYNFEDVEDSLFFLLENKLGYFETDDSEYCEYDFCMEHPFITSKLMPLNNDESSAKVYYPAIRDLETSNGDLISCSFEFMNLVSGFEGYNMNPTYGNWEADLLIYYDLEEMRNIGYNEITLPAYTLDEDYIDEVGSNVREYRFSCKQQEFYEVEVEEVGSDVEEISDVSDDSSGYRLIAYKEFTLEPGEELLITYEDLEEGEDAEEGEFDEVVAEIKEVTEDIGIRAIESECTSDSDCEMGFACDTITEICYTDCLGNDNYCANDYKCQGSTCISDSTIISKVSFRNLCKANFSRFCSKYFSPESNSFYGITFGILAILILVIFGLIFYFVKRSTGGFYR